MSPMVNNTIQFQAIISGRWRLASTSFTRFWVIEKVCDKKHEADNHHNHHNHHDHHDHHDHREDFDHAADQLQRRLIYLRIQTKIPHMEDSRLTQEDLDYFKSLPLEVQEEFIRNMTYARVHADMTSEVPIWEKDQEIERLPRTTQEITKRTKEMQLSHQDAVEYPEEVLKEANEREQKLSLETVESKKESGCAEDIDTSNDPPSQPRHSHVENLEAVRKEDLEQGFACDSDALWREKLSKEIKDCLLKHKSSFLRFEKTILESEV
ncbi:hypothetical protein HYALB_00001551 [Hymenoscyphus albidus]|uniref:Uncharacterized protein n=1 Tax=Hymenoscyphus albidus TaxID=595503 RepID=A0A9N9LE14_9HELO|nr:hypothetical protein HYALB_00001551 [Hymenoscyphus albidus]